MTGRKPSRNENALLERLFREQRDLFTADGEAAQKLLSVGEAKNDETLDRAQLAAAAVLAEALLNHDESVMRR